MFTYEGIKVISRPSENPHAVERRARLFNFIYLQTNIVARLLKPLEVLVAKRVLAVGQFVRDETWKSHNGELTDRLVLLNKGDRTSKKDIILDAHFAALSILKAAKKPK